jgi:hypothetical protein
VFLQRKTHLWNSALEVQMSNSISTSESVPVNGWKRRGVLAAAWAAVAALGAKVMTQPLEAGVDGDVVLGQRNATPGATTILNTTPNSVALIALNTDVPSQPDQLGITGQGLHGEGAGWGVVGFSFINQPGTPGTGGVYGATNRSDAYGVLGWNPWGIGVAGQTGFAGQATSTANSIGVYGANFSSYAGPTPGAGGFGIYGISSKGPGVVGATVTAGAAAVVGATNNVVGAYAAVFYGPVVVGGDFTVLGAKSAAILHSDGSYRRLYCMESPESWFEDFGRGKLEGGCAEIAIEPDFSAVANLDDYHVFLTGCDDFELRVSSQSHTGFRVEAKDAASTGRFSWRIVAKRKDIGAPRFEPVSIPPAPVLPAMPEGPPEAAPMAGMRAGSRANAHAPADATPGGGHASRAGARR